MRKLSAPHGTTETTEELAGADTEATEELAGADTETTEELVAAIASAAGIIMSGRAAPPGYVHYYSRGRNIALRFGRCRD